MSHTTQVDRLLIRPITAGQAGWPATTADTSLGAHFVHTKASPIKSHAAITSTTLAHHHRAAL